MFYLSLFSLQARVTSAMANDKVMQLSTFPRVDAIPRRESHARLPVLVRVTVPPAAAAERRAPVDLVTVLDISCGGGGAAAAKRLELIRKAMDLVIGKLGADDRLAIVPFHSSVADHTGLLEMSVEGRTAACRKVGSLSVRGGTKLFPALSTAVEILEGRRGEEERGRVGFVVLISDGDDCTIFRATIHPKYPVHAFGFRGAHDARALHYVADHTSGVYAILDDEDGCITDAFAACVRRVTSVVGVEAQIDLTCGGAGASVCSRTAASLSAIESGRHYKSHVEESLSSGFIYAGTLSAGDVKSFLVYVDVDREVDVGKDVTEVLTVHGTYLDAPRRKDLVHADERTTVVERRDDCRFPVVSREVAAELVRVETVKMVAGVMDRCKGLAAGAAATAELRAGWCRVKMSEDARAAGAASLASLARELDEMEASLAMGSGLSYMLSWLTRHRLQLHAAAPPTRCRAAAPPSANAAAVEPDAGGAGGRISKRRRCVEMDMIEERLAYWSKVKHDLPLMFADGHSTAAAAEASTGAGAGDRVAAVFRDASVETINRAMFQDVYLVRATN